MMIVCCASTMSASGMQGKDQCQSDETHEGTSDRDVVGGTQRLLAEVLEGEPCDSSRRPRHFDLPPVHAQSRRVSFDIPDDPSQRLVPCLVVVLSFDEPAARSGSPPSPGIDRAKVARFSSVRFWSQAVFGAGTEPVVGRRGEVDHGCAVREGGQKGRQGRALDPLLVQVYGRERSDLAFPFVVPCAQERPTFRDPVRSSDNDPSEPPIPRHDAADESGTGNIDKLDLVEREKPALRLDQVERDLGEDKLASTESRVMRGSAT
jgi:hypothetical protein